MLVLSWILQGVLALAFLGVGAMKLARTRAQLVEGGMVALGDYTEGSVKAIGAAEVLGALGLVLPTLLGVAPILTPIAATGLFLLMLGAVVVHVRRGETGGAAPALVLGLLSLVVAILRFGPLAS